MADTFTLENFVKTLQKVFVHSNKTEIESLRNGVQIIADEDLHACLHEFLGYRSDPRKLDHIVWTEIATALLSKCRRDVFFQNIFVGESLIFAALQLNVSSDCLKWLLTDGWRCTRTDPCTGSESVSSDIAQADDSVQTEDTCGPSVRFLPCLDPIVGNEGFLEKTVLKIQNKAGLSPLNFAIKYHCNAELVECLISLGYDAASADTKGNTLVHHMAEWTPKTVSNETETDTLKALESVENLSTVVNQKNMDGNCPLHLFATQSNTNVNIIRWIITKGADVYSLNGKDKTPVQIGVRERNQRFLENILEFTGIFHVYSNPEFTTKEGELIWGGVTECYRQGEESLSIIKILKYLTDKLVDLPLPTHRYETCPANENELKPLEHAASHRLPEVCDLLLQYYRKYRPKPSSDWYLKQNKKDSRLPLHYAAEQGSYHLGLKCYELMLQALISIRDKKGVSILQPLFLTKDKNHNTVFMLVCKNCPAPSVMQLLGMGNFDISLTQQNIKSLLEHCPEALSVVMDRAFTPSEEISSVNRLRKVNMDFRIFTGYKSESNSLGTKTEILQCIHNWPYYIQKSFFSHPLPKLFIRKQSKDLAWWIRLSYISQIFWLASFSIVACGVQPRSPLSYFAHGWPQISSKIIMLILLVSHFLVECLDFYRHKRDYFTKGISTFWSIPEAALSLAVLVFTLYPAKSMEIEWLYKCLTSMGIILSYIIGMRRYTMMYDKFSLIKSIYVEVLREMITILAFGLPLLVGFALGFSILLSPDFSMSIVPAEPLVRTMIMMMGEMEYDNIFRKDDWKNMDELVIKQWIGVGWFSIFFIMFFVVIPVGFYNLLSGFAFHKVKELCERAEVNQMLQKILLLHQIETRAVMINPILRMLCGVNHNCVRDEELGSRTNQGHDENDAKQAKKMPTEELKLTEASMKRWQISVEDVEEIVRLSFSDDNSFESENNSAKA